MTSGAHAPKCNMEEKLFFLSAQNILLYTVILRLSFLYKIMYYLLCKRILLVMFTLFLCSFGRLGVIKLIMHNYFLFFLVLYSSSRFTHLVNHLKFYYHRISRFVFCMIIFFPFDFLSTFTDHETSWQNKERAHNDSMEFSIMFICISNCTLWTSLIFSYSSPSLLALLGFFFIFLLMDF